MATKLAFTDRELLERFREAYPELSIYQMADIDDDEFAERYAEALNYDPWQGRRVHRDAAEIKEQVALIWINLKEAASSHLKQTLFNNIPPKFLEHLQSIPSYDRLSGSLDFIDYDHARSIFGPAYAKHFYYERLQRWFRDFQHLR
jgi:hypothetical protein